MKIDFENCPAIEKRAAIEIAAPSLRLSVHLRGHILIGGEKMRENRLRLYVHLVWATWDRLPLIEPGWERRLHRCIADQAAELECRVLALNGMADHVHLLVGLPATLDVACLVKQVKGVSSRLANEELRVDHAFKWQGGYGAFTVSRWDVKKVSNYIHNQKEHHANEKIIAALEEIWEQDDD